MSDYKPWIEEIIKALESGYATAKAWNVIDPKTGRFVTIYNNDRLKAAEEGERRLGLASCQAEIVEYTPPPIQPISFIDVEFLPVEVEDDTGDPIK